MEMLGLTPLPLRKETHQPVPIPDLGAPYASGPLGISSLVGQYAITKQLANNFRLLQTLLDDFKTGKWAMEENTRYHSRSPSTCT